MKYQRALRTRRGFTYIELVLSLTISSILLLGLTSVILIGSRAIPTGTEQIHTEASVGEVLAMMAEDLELATDFTRQSSRSFTVTVPDRDGDSSPEQITYKMATIPGALTKKWNADAATSIIDLVTSMNIDLTDSSGKTSRVQVTFYIPSMTNPFQSVQAELFNMPER